VTCPIHHRILKHGLAGIAAMLMSLALPICARGAISEGPKCTNAVAAEQRRTLQFFEAEQSYQEKLKVGRERYEQKQIIRGKVIAAMAAELQARQQTVVIHHALDPDGNADKLLLGFRFSPAVTVLIISFAGFACYLKRLKLTFHLPRPEAENSAPKNSRGFRRRYRVTALKPVTICANVEVSKVERTLLGAKVRRTKDEPAWIQLKAGEIQDQLGIVFGIHPNHMPHGKRISLTDADLDIIPLEAWTDGELPKNFFEYFKLEVSA
jgi:hypothetical protein